jgi:hypothetical protein
MGGGAAGERGAARQPPGGHAADAGAHARPARGGGVQHTHAGDARQVRARARGTAGSQGATRGTWRCTLVSRQPPSSHIHHPKSSPNNPTQPPPPSVPRWRAFDAELEAAWDRIVAALLARDQPAAARAILQVRRGAAWHTEGPQQPLPSPTPLILNSTPIRPHPASHTSPSAPRHPPPPVSPLTVTTVWLLLVQLHAPRARHRGRRLHHPARALLGRWHARHRAHPQGLPGGGARGACGGDGASAGGEGARLLPAAYCAALS